jgi:integrase
LQSLRVPSTLFTDFSQKTAVVLGSVNVKEDGFYQTIHKLRDGNIMLYTRVDTKKPVWHVRIKKPGSYSTVSQRYITQSMKTTNLAEASAEAEEIYDDLRYKARNNIPLDVFSLQQMYDKYMSTVAPQLSKVRRETIRKSFERFYLPFMGSTKVDEIKPQLLTRYWQWRMDYWTTGVGSKTGLPTVGSVPKKSTLDLERQSLKQVMKWACEQNYIQKEPVIASPHVKEVAGEEDEFTPAFTWSEWTKLTNYFTSTYLPKKSEDIKKFWARNPKLNSGHLYGRYMLVAFMRIGVYSGLRPQELLALKWKHVEYYTYNGEQHVKFNVPKVKTKPRTNICLPRCIEFLEDLKKRSKYIGNDDYLINTEKEGKKAPSQRKKLIGVLTKMDMLTDKLGNSFKPYSVRHTYVTARLLYSPAGVDDIASNIGTSREMIEAHYNHVLAEQQTEIHTQTNRQLDN